MQLMSIRKVDVPGFVDALLEGFELFGPRPKEDWFVFGGLPGAAGLLLDYPTTLLPPKKYVLPQRETLFTYSIGEGVTKLSPSLDHTKRAVLGVHSCDLHGLWLLDDVFSEGNPDAHYLTRRENTRVIGIDCKAPCSENSFCKSMGTLAPGGGYDLFLTDLGESYAVQVGTPAGKALLDLGRFQPADYALKEAFFTEWRRKTDVFPDRLGYDTTRLPALLTASYDDEIWDELENRCFDCGACTVVCPTCYCFDVQDETDVTISRGERYRRWDSCQLTDFAVVAGGHNFRGKRSDRLRHRHFRKGKYFKEKFGRFACVGCGRCGRACLVHIDVLDVFRRLGSYCR